jgi:hypothetical protein
MDRVLGHLSRSVASQDHQAVLVHAEECLALSPKHTVASQCKAVALVHLGEYQLAECITREIGGFLHAYVLYRLRKNEEAKNAVLKEEGNDALHLKAQIVNDFEKMKIDFNNCCIIGV